jgi:hypothetical protein
MDPRISAHFVRLDPEDSHQIVVGVVDDELAELPLMGILRIKPHKVRRNARVHGASSGLRGQAGCRPNSLPDTSSRGAQLVHAARLGQLQDSLASTAYILPYRVIALSRSASGHPEGAHYIPAKLCRERGFFSLST